MISTKDAMIGWKSNNISIYFKRYGFVKIKYHEKLFLHEIEDRYENE